MNVLINVSLFNVPITLSYILWPLMSHSDVIIKIISRFYKLLTVIERDAISLIYYVFIRCGVVNVPYNGTA